MREAQVRRREGAGGVRTRASTDGGTPARSHRAAGRGSTRERAEPPTSACRARATTCSCAMPEAPRCWAERVGREGEQGGSGRGRGRMREGEGERKRGSLVGASSSSSPCWRGLMNEKKRIHPPPCERQLHRCLSSSSWRRLAAGLSRAPRARARDLVHLAIVAATSARRALGASRLHTTSTAMAASRLETRDAHLGATALVLALQPCPPAAQRAARWSQAHEQDGAGTLRGRGDDANERELRHPRARG